MAGALGQVETWGGQSGGEERLLTLSDPPCLSDAPEANGLDTATLRMTTRAKQANGVSLVPHRPLGLHTSPSLEFSLPDCPYYFGLTSLRLTSGDRRRWRTV